LYVRHFNYQYSRSGSLFEDRFKSSLVQDEFSRIDIEATSTLLQVTSSLDSTIRVTQLPLDKLSVYLEKAIGHQVKTGQLDVESTVNVNDQQLDVKIDALLRKFRVNPSDRSDVDNELGMPLGAALNLVRDGDDNITLNGIKLKGDLNDPAVSAKQLLTKAVSKALLAGTMTYFKFALQPYGAALMAVQAIGKQAGKVSLDPLMMQPRTAEIAIENADYLDRLADLMAQRPQIHLVICGEASTITDIPESPEVAVPEGVEPVDHTPMLIALADERAKLIKRMLFETGIASERLLICKSDLTDEPAGARVILGVD
jgi:hypothetical protein